MSAVSRTPLVSVIVTTHKRHDLLREALASVMEQTWPEIEAVVVDDAGEDETREIVAQIDPVGRRLRWHDRAEVSERKGAQPARNAGFMLARGNFVIFLDDDDLLAPDCITNRMSTLLDRPDVDACVGQCRQFVRRPSEDGPLWRTWTCDQDDLCMFLKSAVPWQTSGPLWRREALIRTGPWDVSLSTGHDYEFHIRALSRGVKFLRRNAVDYFWRSPRPDSHSGSDRMRSDHRDGGHIRAFTLGIEAIGASRAWTPARRGAASTEAVRLAIVCRLHGGTFSTAIKALDAARGQACMGPLEYAEVRSAMAAWGTIAGKIPALTWLRRRGYSAADTSKENFVA